MSSELSPKHSDIDPEDETGYIVITRTGRKEPLDTNQITKRFKALINRKPHIQHVNPFNLMLEVTKGLKSGITTYEIDEYAANASASLSIGNPHYLSIAGRIAIDNHQKNTMRSFVDKMRKAYLNTRNGKPCPLINSTFFKYVEEHQDFIEANIDYSRDFYLDFFGFRTFQQNYSIKVDKKPIERPQDMFMRTAIAINMNVCEPDDIATELSYIKETYDMLSNKNYTHASPTYYNAGGLWQQLASCFLLGTEDSLEGIEKTGTDMSRISKRAGGIGVHINCWRSTGAYINGTNGQSNGIGPFLRTYETRMLAFNQGGRRPGAAAIYLMIHHPDVLLFIEMRRNDGAEEMRARKLNYALWIPDIFMERVENGEMWSFFDPFETIDLSNYYGEEYKRRYLQLEKDKLYSKQIPARLLWEEIKESNKEFGQPYICYSDPVNYANMQSNVGVIKSSNLCVSGDTLILTDNGYLPIKQLAESAPPVHNVWNGNEFTRAAFAKTGDDKKLLEVKFSNGAQIKCTPEHRFKLNCGVVVQANELNLNDKLMVCKLPTPTTDTPTTDTPTTDTPLTVTSIMPLEDTEDTYCFNEPKKHMGIFNGVPAMNCTEIFLHSTSEEYAVCILCSIGLPNCVVDAYSVEELQLPESDRRPLNHVFPINPMFDFRKLIEITKVATRNLNNIVNKTFHPVPESKRGNERHRPIGIGVQGLDDAYSKMRIAFDSPEAAKLVREIFECIYFSALTMSSVLCRKKWQALKKKCSIEGSVTVNTFIPTDYDVHPVTYTNPKDIPKKVAAYPSMEWNGGSPISKGIFHWELYKQMGAKVELSGMFDWESLRTHILEFGVMNSHLVAVMPTASTSQLLGNNECIEPYTSNIYKRDTLAGEYIVIKKYLINDLYNLGLWNTNLKNYLIATEGSIQNIDNIPDSIKSLYKTAWEIDQSVLIQHAIDIQPFVDLGISLNLYVRDFTLTKWNEYQFQAYYGRLKTGKYYLHTEAGASPQKFTIDPSKQKEMEELLKKNKNGTAFMEPLRDICEACSG